MLKKVAAEVPNIDWERSVIGGLSNGAQTLSVLLAGRYEFITLHFHAFWLHKGGFQFMSAAMPLKDSRYLLLVVADAMTGGSELRRLTLDQTALLEPQAKLKIDLTQWKDEEKNPDSCEMPRWPQGKPWSGMPTRGRIGFQGRHAGIQFRKVKLLRLKQRC